jgi:hypothetical protein
MSTPFLSFGISAARYLSRPFSGCSDCHKDAHDNQFANAPYNNRCEACHTVIDFDRTTFTIAKHKSTRFTLTGARSCSLRRLPQSQRGARRTDKILPFRFEDRDCTSTPEIRTKGSLTMAWSTSAPTALYSAAKHVTPQSPG